MGPEGEGMSKDKKEKAQKFWAVVVLVSFALVLIAASFNHTSSIAFAIIFASSLYGFKNEL